jgi:chemotaxis signal transduction protein
MNSTPQNTLLRSRHHRKRLKEETVQLITFQLRQDRFALPITAVERVIPLERVYGDASQSGVGLTLYQGQELVLVDVGQRIFGELGSGDRPLLQSPAEAPDSLEQTRLLLILKASREQSSGQSGSQSSNQSMGIPIDSRPLLKRVVKTAIAPIPQEYQTSGKIKCISSLSVQAEGEPLLFLLDAEQLFEALALQRI